jgi:cell wall-associated NlpC family hydrolase
MQLKFICLLVLLVTVSANIEDGDDLAVRFDHANGTDASKAFALLLDSLLGFSNGDKVCATTTLNIRSAPGTGSDVLFTTTDGEELMISSPQTWNANDYSWNQVSGRSKTGYAASSYLQSCGGGATVGAIKGPCGTYSDPRGAVVRAAHALYDQRKYETYSQSATRWSGISGHVCPPKAPPHSDCSSAVTWAYWTVFGNGVDFINGQHWGAGYTGTQVDHGKLTSSPKPGDLVFYGKSRSAISHVAMYVGDGKVISHGSDPVSWVDKNYRSDLQFIKTYL